MKATLHDQAACCRVAVTALERIVELIKDKKEPTTEEQAIFIQSTSTLEFLGSFTSSAQKSQRPKHAREKTGAIQPTCDCADEGMTLKRR